MPEKKTPFMKRPVVRIVVEVPTVLRRYTEGKHEVPAEGAAPLEGGCF